MIRKVSHIIISLLLLVSTTGITISKHYCGGRLRSVSVLSEPVSCCDMEGCCHNETDIYRLDDDFTASMFIVDFEQVEVPQESVTFTYLVTVTQNLTEDIFYDGPSPPELRLILSSYQSFLL